MIDKKKMSIHYKSILYTLSYLSVVRIAKRNIFVPSELILTTIVLWSHYRYR